MEPDEKPPQPERENTDSSLRSERRNTDRALEERRAHVEESADALLERARERADIVLEEARDQADETLDSSHAGAEVRNAVAIERTRADVVVEEERAAADETLRIEREEEARSLAALLPLERKATDRHLLTERARSDDAVSHRDDFFGIVSHDLRNLLGGIAGHAMLIARQASESDEGRRTVAGMDLIQRYVARMNRLVGDLVDVASIDAGKLSIEPERGDAAALLNDAVKIFVQQASEKGISLDAVLGAGALPAEIDSERVLQVLANLITNAIKFTPRGGKITVNGEVTGHDLLIRVIDTGSGIADNALDKIFERFWQVGKDDRRGLGLGLYISKCIVDAHGGRIWVESTPGSGSTFYVTLPLSAKTDSLRPPAR